MANREENIRNGGWNAAYCNGVMSYRLYYGYLSKAVAINMAAVAAQWRLAGARRRQPSMAAGVVKRNGDKLAAAGSSTAGYSWRLKQLS
jgi:hypothetical protein